MKSIALSRPVLAITALTRCWNDVPRAQHLIVSERQDEMLERVCLACQPTRPPSPSWP